MASTTRNCLAILALYVCLVNGAKFFMPSRENPAHPGKCYDYQLNKAVAVGDSITDHSSCTRLLCFKTEDTPPAYNLQGATCLYAKELPANCHVVEGDSTLDYPDCCSKVQCDGEPQGVIREVGK